LLQTNKTKVIEQFFFSNIAKFIFKNVIASRCKYNNTPKPSEIV